MAKPKVFISSTYVDLIEIRDDISRFLEMSGLTPILFERGGVNFDFNKKISDSCVDEVKKCDTYVLIVGGRYGSSAEKNSNVKKYNSITSLEFAAAQEKGIPTYVFVNQNVLTEFETYQKNRDNKEIKYVFVDNTSVFKLILNIKKNNPKIFINGYSTANDITTSLTSSFAHLLGEYMKQATEEKAKNKKIKINSFKLFYYRHRSKITINDLATKCKINKNEIIRLERMVSGKQKFIGYNTKYFPYCSSNLLRELEAFLNCKGKLTVEQKDDFLSMYLEYYKTYKGKKVKNNVSRHPMLNFSTKVVVFDFDGTIVNDMHSKSSPRTSWEILWEVLGYKVNDCAFHHRRFRKGEISHEEWCQVTLQKFKSKGCTTGHLTKVANQLELIDGFDDLLSTLKGKNIKIYILSGSMKELIKILIGTKIPLFEEVQANSLIFNKHKKLIDIDGTIYDFQGKADFIRKIVKEKKCSPMDVLYIGNAGNDAWVSESGARTVCINPTSTDPNNPKEWTESLNRVKNINDILAFVT